MTARTNASPARTARSASFSCADRKPEHGQDPVALDLHDVAVEFGFDDLATGGAVPAHQPAIRLRLPALGELGGSDDVGEQDREATQLGGARTELGAADGGRLGHVIVIQTHLDLFFFPTVTFTSVTYVAPRHTIPSARRVNSSSPGLSTSG